MSTKADAGRIELVQQEYARLRTGSFQILKLWNGNYKRVREDWKSEHNQFIVISFHLLGLTAFKNTTNFTNLTVSI